MIAGTQMPAQMLHDCPILPPVWHCGNEHMSNLPQLMRASLCRTVHYRLDPKPAKEESTNAVLLVEVVPEHARRKY